MAFEAEVKASFAALAEKLEFDENARRKAKFIRACENWAQNYGNGPKPVADGKVDGIVSFEKFFSFELVETPDPVDSRDPSEWLPKNFQATHGAEEIGAELKHMPGFYSFTGTAKWPEAGEVREKDGAKFRFFRPYPFMGVWAKL